jgi:SH3-like domain-containing protein
MVWRATRIVVPWVALIVIAVNVWSLVTDYRDSVNAAESTSTVEATPTVSFIPEGQPYVRVLSDGLNLRVEPSTDASVVGVLNGDQQLALIEEGVGWYRVRTVDGVEGWVAAGGRYTELIQP